MAQDLEKLAVEIERPIGCLSRTVFWILFVIFGAILGVIGWFVYTSFWAGTTHIALSENHKDALIVALSVIVLSVTLAAIVRDSMRRAIYQRVLRRRAKS
jgi:TRAP-type C4-dicarboxylate transport system permease small subunit